MALGTTLLADALAGRATISPDTSPPPGAPRAFTAPLQAGSWIGTYQAQAQAPLDYISGSRMRPIDGHTIRGAWSDPWWVYSPEHGWGIAKTWRNKLTQVGDYDPESRRYVYRPFPACEEIVITEWKAS